MGKAFQKEKAEWLRARITPKQKELFLWAAGLSGKILEDFVVEAVQAASEETIQRHRILELSARSTDALLAALENPLPPNASLIKATHRFRALMAE